MWIYHHRVCVSVSYLSDTLLTSRQVFVGATTGVSYQCVGWLDFTSWFLVTSEEKKKNVKNFSSICCVFLFNCLPVCLVLLSDQALIFGPTRLFTLTTISGWQHLDRCPLGCRETKHKEHNRHMWRDERPWGTFMYAMAHDRERVQELPVVAYNILSSRSVPHRWWVSRWSFSRTRFSSWNNICFCKNIFLCGDVWLYSSVYLCKDSEVFI